MRNDHRSLPLFVTLAAALLIAVTRAATAQEDHTARLDAVTAQIQANPSDPVLWVQRAELHRQNKEFDSALTDVDKIDQLKPNWSLGSLERAKIDFDSGKLDYAVREASDCIRQEPSNTEALILRARAQAWLKNYEAAAADYNAVLTGGVFPSPPLDLYLERSRAQAAAHDLDGAIHGLDEGMRKLGDTAALALPAIDYERQRGTFEAALDRLDRAKAYYSPEAYDATRGEILMQANRPADAKEAFLAGITKVQNLPADRRNQPLTVALDERLHSGWKQAQAMTEPLKTP